MCCTAVKNRPDHFDASRRGVNFSFAAIGIDDFQPLMHRLRFAGAALWKYWRTRGYEAAPLRFAIIFPVASLRETSGCLEVLSFYSEAFIHFHRYKYTAESRWLIGNTALGAVFAHLWSFRRVC
jgi:hypothetical protein